LLVRHRETGNRQPATGNRQPATGNRQCGPIRRTFELFAAQHRSHRRLPVSDILRSAA